jgi:hypothetical protein
MEQSRRTRVVFPQTTVQRHRAAVRSLRRSLGGNADMTLGRDAVDHDRRGRIALAHPEANASSDDDTRGNQRRGNPGRLGCDA